MSNVEFADSPVPPPRRKPLYKNLTVQVLTAVAIGVTIGAVKPSWGIALQPLADGFIKLVKMVVGPIIFLTIVGGIAAMGDLKKVGRVGIKALVYFEIVTTLALAIGLIVANVVQPGVGVKHHRTSQPAVLTTSTAATLPATQAASQPVDKETARLAQIQKDAHKGFVQFILDIIPDNVVGAFAKGDLLQILTFSVIFGIALAAVGNKAPGLLTIVEQTTEVMFKVVAIVMKAAPLGAMGAMAFTVGEHGLDTLRQLAWLMGCVYLTMALFIFIVLWAVCWFSGFSLWRYLVFIREEILLVLGTSSSESALPFMIKKLERMGCGKGIVSMVIPAGYSFNLDGTSIYLSMAFIFMVQLFGVPLTIGQQLYVLLILMLTSKGAAGVTGAGFITLAATMEATQTVPVASLAILFGVDRFMSEARAITNLIGNGVATIVVSKWEGEFDHDAYKSATAPRAAIEVENEIGAIR